MNSDAAELGEAKRPAWHRTPFFWFAFGTLQLLAISALAVALTPVNEAPLLMMRGMVGFVTLVLAECAVLLLAVFLVALVLAAASRRLAVAWSTMALVLLLPWFYVDWLMHRAFDLRLATPRTWEFIGPVLSRAGDFSHQANVPRLVAVAVGYLLVQIIFFAIARALTIRLPRQNQGFLMRGALVAAVLTVLSVAVQLGTAPDLSTPFLPSSDAHPIHVTGWFDRLKVDRLEATPLDWLCMAQLVATHAQWDNIENAYRALKVQGSPERSPDIIVFVVESLRLDAITPKGAPRLTALGDRALVGMSHYSTGNSTPLGYFGLLYGLHAAWYSRAVENAIPPALTTLMAQLGYYRAFIGSWSLSGWTGMDEFLNEKNFDQFEILPMGASYVDGDRAMLERATAMLQRAGPYQYLADQPLCLVLQVNTTHFGFHSESQDEIFLPTIAHIPLPPWNQAEQRQVMNRYANSVHCMDRLIATLFDREAIVIVVGDHGQSFGEDGFLLHGSAVSQVQMQTPLIVTGPGIQPTRIQHPTSHLDVLPTVLGALGVELNRPTLLHGRNLLDPESLMQRTPLVLGSHYRDHWIVTELGGSKNSPDWFRFQGDPLTADFRWNGMADPRSGEVRAAQVPEERLREVFQRMTAQLSDSTTAPAPPDAVASLIDSATRGSVETRLLAIKRIGEMGRMASSAAPHLRRFTQDASAEIRAASAEAILEIKRSQ